MTTVIQTQVKVHKHMRDSWHVYTCDQLPGLYVASKDHRIAYEDVPFAIRELIRLDFGLECVVAHQRAYPDLQELVTAVVDGIAEQTDEDSGDLSFVVQYIAHAA